MSQLNLNLKISDERLNQLLLSRFISIDQVGLTKGNYLQLRKDHILAGPGGRVPEKPLLTLSECIWLELVKELRTYNVSSGIILKMEQFLMMFIANDITEEKDLTKLQKEFSYSCYLLDIFIAQYLIGKSDSIFEINKAGQFDIISLGDKPTDRIPGPTISISVSQLLESLLGKENVPQYKSQVALVTHPEAEVINAVRTPEFVEVTVEKASVTSNHVWDVIGKEIMVVTNPQGKALVDEVQKSYDRVIFQGQQSSEMPSILFKRKRCW